MVKKEFIGIGFFKFFSSSMAKSTALKKQ